ncbi:MAG TPA: hypothetical protein VFA18_23495, partial [Gemmataceae bacterium]|nr:hypothetical protein [Gemmataceae bacterium]
LGHYQYGTCLLLQAPDRAVFGVSDDALSRLGGSGEEAINAILIGLEPELIDSEVAESSHHRKQ